MLCFIVGAMCGIWSVELEGGKGGVDAILGVACVGVVLCMLAGLLIVIRIRAVVVRVGFSRCVFEFTSLN